ncbi:head-tail connector protein [Amycolatopsis japonica]|uniref:head-tail connector protein n=1 Tax=Amycolatopsis japonica TaxID=208439 RepID=UPI0037BB458D
MWPPTLDALKADLGIDDTRDDAVLTEELNSAIAYVMRMRTDLDFTYDTLDERPKPDADLTLGTLRLAARWHARRKSPEGIIDASEYGVARISAYDTDIERLLGIGRYKRPVIA